MRPDSGNGSPHPRGPTTSKRVSIGSLLVMHAGLEHRTMPVLVSGRVTGCFSVTSKSRIILILAVGAIKAMRLRVASGEVGARNLGDTLAPKAVALEVVPIVTLVSRPSIPSIFTALKKGGRGYMVDDGAVGRAATASSFLLMFSSFVNVNTERGRLWPVGRRGHAGLLENNMPWGCGRHRDRSR